MPIYTPTSVDCFAAHASWPRPVHEPRSLVLRPAVSLVSINPNGFHDYPSRDARALASGGLSLLLAVEITPTGRAPANRSGLARADPANERREPALGVATHSRRIAQARLCRRSIKRRQIHGEAARAAKPGVAHLPAQPCPKYCCDGPVCCTDHRLRPALCAHHRAARSQRPRLDQRHDKPHRNGSRAS